MENESAGSKTSKMSVTLNERYFNAKTSCGDRGAAARRTSADDEDVCLADFRERY